jgi:hypothetical protein
MDGLRTYQELLDFVKVEQQLHGFRPNIALNTHIRLFILPKAFRNCGAIQNSHH